MSKAGPTKTGGRPAIEGIIRGRYSLSVGNPGRPSAPGWKWTKLTDLARLESGHTPSRRNPEYWDGDIPWIGIRDATANHGRTLPDTTQHVTQLGIENSSARVLPAQTVCLSRTASVGYVVVMGAPMATSQDFVNWVCGDHLDHRFLKYVLLAEKESYLSFASGTTHQTIYYPEVKAFHVCHPTVEKQQQIADVLQSIDDLIEDNRRRIEILEEMAQAIYREWFVHFRFPGHENATFVDSPLGPIPKDWVACMASEALTINPRVKALKEVEDPFFTMGDLSEKSMVCAPSETKSGTSGSKFVNGDTLFARITPCLENGKTGFVSGLEEGQVGRGSTEFIVLRGKLVGPAFTYLLARSPEFRGHAIASMSGASGRQRVRNECFDSYDVAIPTTGLVDDFEQLVRPMFEQAFSLHLQSESLNGARDVLLPKLVSGEIDVSDLTFRSCC